MKPEKSLIIRPLETTDAKRISFFLQKQPPEYSHFFYAFGADETKIAQMLEKTKLDVYSGVFWNDELLGIFMLRGWDDDYEIPSFGVLIDEKHKGGTLMRLTLDAAKLICRMSGAKKMMAKIHPDNVSPRGARRLGFNQVGVEEKSGNVIYHLEL